MNNQFVVCAAVRFNNGLIVTGPRHFDKIMNNQLRMMPNLDKSNPEEGFIDQYGTFLNRTEALHIVIINNDQPLSSSEMTFDVWICVGNYTVRVYIEN